MRTAQEWIALAHANGLDVPDDVHIVPAQARCLSALCPSDSTTAQYVDETGSLPWPPVVPEFERIDTMQCQDAQGEPLMGYGPKSNVLAVRLKETK